MKAKNAPVAGQSATALRRWWPALFIALAFAALIAAKYAHRRLLWGLEQVCLVNLKTSGSPFPCLRVNLSQGLARGYAVIGAPFEGPHLVLTPTARIVGVEDSRLRAPGAPNYVADAWAARHLLQAYVDHPLSDEDIGLAVNSRHGRSQDQLHVHISCVLNGFRRRLHSYDARIGETAWFHLPFTLRRRRYWALRLKTGDLRDVNVFAKADTVLAVSPGAREDLTFALLPIGAEPAGFYLLADLYQHGRHGTGHAEFLLNERCSRG